MVNMAANQIVSAVFTREPQSGDQYEEDNTPGTARFIQNDVPETRSIVPANDVDWVVFTLADNSDITIETDGVSGNTRMWLYDSDLNEIAYNDNGAGTLFSVINRTGLAAGTYYVKIDDFNNDDEIESYTLSVTCSAGWIEPDTVFPWNLFLPAILSGQNSSSLH